MAVSLLVESWIWYSVATLVLLLRMVSRSINFGGVHRLKTEDILMLVALVTYTNEIVWMNIEATVDSNLLPPGYLKHHVLTQKEIRARAYGSKVTLVVEQCQCCTIWLIKACLLLMYYRLTKDCYPKHNLAVRILAGYVAFGFVFMEIFYFAVWCRPFHNYWAVPTPDPKQCAAAWNHLITNATLNLSSDLAMIVIALSMAFRLKMARPRKYALLALIMLGFFVIACATANKAYSFTNPYGLQWTFWYIRECSTAVLVANLPYVWTLLRRMVALEGKKTSPDSGRSVTTSKRSIWCLKGSDEENSDVMTGLNVSVPELAYQKKDSRKSSDPERGRSGSWVFGKADALALQDLDMYESSQPNGSTPRRLSPYPPRYDSSSAAQASAGSPEPGAARRPPIDPDAAGAAGEGELDFQTSALITALPSSLESPASVRRYPNN